MLVLVVWSSVAKDYQQGTVPKYTTAISILSNMIVTIVSGLISLDFSNELLCSSFLFFTHQSVKEILLAHLFRSFRIRLLTYQDLVNVFNDWVLYNCVILISQVDELVAISFRALLSVAQKLSHTFSDCLQFIGDIFSVP